MYILYRKINTVCSSQSRSEVFKYLLQYTCHFLNYSYYLHDHGLKPEASQTGVTKFDFIVSPASSRLLPRIYFREQSTTTMLASIARQLTRTPRRLLPIAATHARNLTSAVATNDAPASGVQVLEPEKYFSEFDDSSLRLEMKKLRDSENEAIKAYNVKVVPVDWDHWRSEITYPGLVDELKEIYDSAPMPDYEEEQVKARNHVIKVFDPIIEHYEKVAEQSKIDAIEIDKQLKECAEVRDNIKTLSVEDFLKKFPSIKKSVQDDVANNRWYVDTA